MTFKAYYAIRGLTNPTGEPTGAVYGFLRMLLKFIEVRSPEHLAVVFDTGKPTFRNEMYAPYKANREAPPEDFSVQMGWIFELLAGMGIANYQCVGYEADDLIATMVESKRLKGESAVIVSADKDLFQLVDETVMMIRPGPKTEEEFTPADVEAYLGIRPEQVVDWLALVGDSSDNIPGVPGIGKKTATKLLAQYGSLDNLIAHAGEISRPKLRQSLSDNVEQAHLAQALATVKRDVPFEWDEEACRLPSDLWKTDAVALMSSLGFDNFLREKGIGVPKAEAATEQSAPIGQPTLEYEMVSDVEQLDAWLAVAMKAEWVALDTETTGLDVMRADLVGISLSHTPGKAIYIPVGHRFELAGCDQLDLAVVRERLTPLLAGQGPCLTAHHAKYDWKMLRRAGFQMVAPAFDSMIASYLLNPDKLTGHGLKALGMEHCGVSMTPIKHLIGSGAKAITMADVPVDQAGPYACADADVTLRLHNVLAETLRREEPLWRVMTQVELPLVMVLLEMEMGGFTIDVDCLRQLGVQVDTQLSGLARKLWESAGHPFNVGSPKQVATILFEELGLKPGKKGKTGYSTNEAELERLANDHPIVRLILEYRGAEKLKSTYIEALPKLVNLQTGRIHTSFNQTVAATGRLSSSDPNLQNIPIRSEMGRTIRRAFIADHPDHDLLKADYSQIELRILAHLSGDRVLAEAYREGLDIHRQTAGEVFGVKVEDVTPQMRSQAKVINFGIIYGMSAHGLAQQLGLSRGEAASFIERYFATYPSVREWMDRLLEEARTRGWVETMLGRRRMLPELNARNGMVRGNAERVAINTPVQGTCADMIKLAMISVHEGLGAVAPGARMVCQVHDELVFTVPREQREALTDFVRREMTEALPLDVPVVVDISHGPNWAEC